MIMDSAFKFLNSIPSFYLYYERKYNNCQVTMFFSPYFILRNYISRLENEYGTNSSNRNSSMFPLPFNRKTKVSGSQNSTIT